MVREFAIYRSYQVEGRQQNAELAGRQAYQQEAAQHPELPGPQAFQQEEQQHPELAGPQAQNEQQHPELVGSVQPLGPEPVRLAVAAALPSPPEEEQDSSSQMDSSNLDSSKEEELSATSLDYDLESNLNLGKMSISQKLLLVKEYFHRNYEWNPYPKTTRVERIAENYGVTVKQVKQLFNRERKKRNITIPWFKNLLGLSSRKPCRY